MPDGSRTLLLNATYEPIKIVSWQKAVVLWFQDKVEIIEFSTIHVFSSCKSFQLPSILRLKSYVHKNHMHHIRFSRENVYLRDNYTCQYCGKFCSHKELTLDHVIPVSKNGPKSWTNVVSACRTCNQRKANKTPQNAGMPLLSEPKAPSWLPSPELDPLRNRFPEEWLSYLKTG